MPKPKSQEVVPSVYLPVHRLIDEAHNHTVVHQIGVAIGQPLLSPADTHSSSFATVVVHTICYKVCSTYYTTLQDSSGIHIVHKLQ